MKAVFELYSMGYKQDFSHSTCLLTINVGQAAYEGEKLEKIIRLMNNNFKQCYILIDDRFQKNIMYINGDDSPDFYDKESILAGDLWIHKNETIYSQLTIPYKIERWAQWLSHNKYQKKHDLISDRYIEDTDYAQAFIISANAYLDKLLASLEDKEVDKAKMFTYCVSYLKEISTVFCLCAEAGYHFDIRLEERDLVLSKTYDIFIKPTMPESLNALTIKFI